MKYQEKSLTINAYKIVSVGSADDGKTLITIDNGTSVTSVDGQMPKTFPVAGDYWVVKSDGHSFWMQKDVFENKYEAVDTLESNLPLLSKEYKASIPIAPITALSEATEETA